MGALGLKSTTPSARTTAAHPTRRSVLRAVAVVLIVVGVLALADAGATLVWREPLASLYAHVQQGRLDDRLAELERASPPPIVGATARRPNPQPRFDLAARAVERNTRDGDPLARLRVPRIGLSAVVVQGTAGGDLSKGPGHYPRTPLPGERGTVGIAGHRTTFGAWFRHIDDLKRGDPIGLAMPYATFTYRVERTQIVPSDALWITRTVGFNRLVLSACHPLYSASQRIVVFARLVGARRPAQYGATAPAAGRRIAPSPTTRLS